MKFFSKNKDSSDDFTKLVREFSKIPDGKPIPRDGVCSFFYDHFTYAGQTIPLRSKDGYVFFHIENDDVIQELLEGIPSVHVADEDGRTLVSVLFKTGTVINWIRLVIETADPSSRAILTSMIEKKKIVIGLLNLVYGAIAKERTLTVPIPNNILYQIKKAAG